jgi:hypothetical protein
MHRARTTDADREPGRPDSLPSRAVAPSSAPMLDPVLGLQATAGNAAVTALLRRTGEIRVQRIWDDEQEDGDAGGGEPEQGPAPGDGPTPDEGSGSPGGAEPGSGEPDAGSGAPDATALGDVEAQARTDLDPAAVINALAPYATGDDGPGDYPMPGDGTTAQALFVQRDPPDGPGPAPRAGGPGDVLKALMPYLQPALDKLLANVTDAINRLKTGEKIATAVVLAPIVIAPLTQPGPRKFALDQLDGTDVTFGVVPNLQVKPSITDGQLRGGTVTYDLAPALRKLGLPF